jgi:quercetin dioxygenase-like cupin family protein
MHHTTQMRARACLLFSLVTLVACDRDAPRADARERELHPPMAAASGVARADGGKGPQEHRAIPLRPMSGDVEILYGDPEAVGEPFVMRIRELPGTIVPPHSHPVDEHITVVKGTWYFGLGEEFNPQALEELKTGAYAFAPKGSWMFGYCPAGNQQTNTCCTTSLSASLT